MTDITGRRALARAMEDTDQLLLYYQPIHCATSGDIYGAEALLRQRRESGEVREASIIPETAEESDGDELFRLDSMLIKRAYVDAASWQERFPAVRLNVNLSPREFQEGNVIERLTALIASCGIDHGKVNLEITETSHIDDPEETMDVLRTIKELGVGLWLDDFGMGFSSLSHLQHFPLDGIKLPGGFVRPLPDNARCRAICRALIRLAHDLGLRVIAEEVETKEQLELLRELQCDYIQGFLFSRPMPLEPFSRWLEGN
jgi:EAL domain-containing protein (putative c-di-GMP-specific phosphodiesterase class I)